MPTEVHRQQRLSVSLREYVETKIHDLGHQMDLKIDALKEAFLVKNEALDDKLQHMNEFRDALKDQNSNFITKAEYAALIVRIDERYEKLYEDIKDLTKSRDEAQGKADQSTVNITIMLSVVGLIFGLIALLKTFF